MGSVNASWGNRRMVLGIDSGRNTGWALARDGRIFKCGLATLDDKRPAATPRVYGCRVFIEYPIDRREVDPNDLIKLGSRAGRIQERYLERSCSVTFVLPSTWKGSVPKHIHEPRIRACLDGNERIAVEKCLEEIAPSLQNNVWDAIGIALWAVKRDPNRIIMGTK